MKLGFVITFLANIIIPLDSEISSQIDNLTELVISLITLKDSPLLVVINLATFS